MNIFTTSILLLSLGVLISAYGVGEKRARGVDNSMMRRCRQPIVDGPCRALFRRFGYDTVNGKCKMFGYGGCGGNDNRFETEDECTKTCGFVAKQPACSQVDNTKVKKGCLLIDITMEDGCKNLVENCENAKATTPCDKKNPMKAPAGCRVLKLVSSEGCPIQAVDCMSEYVEPQPLVKDPKVPQPGGDEDEDEDDDDEGAEDAIIDPVKL